MVKETVGSRSVRDGQPQRNGKSTSQGAMVEVMVDGQIGYGATNDLSAAGLQAAAELAQQQAMAASRWAIHSLTPAVRPKVVGQYASPFVKPLDALTPAEINDLLVQLCQKLQVSDQIVQTLATAITNETESWFVSSNGSEVYQKFLMLETHYGATAQDGAIVQQRSSNGHDARGRLRGGKHGRAAWRANKQRRR